MDRQQVRQLLLSERNAGLREYRGDVVGGAGWPAIVTEDVWRMAVAKLTDPTRRSGATRGRKYLLSNIAHLRAVRLRAGLGHQQPGPAPVSLQPLPEAVARRCEAGRAGDREGGVAAVPSSTRWSC